MFLNNQRGQMAIFVALFFQVLFIFFAMAINVGLVVHDKINLQNAVDIAAYYGAAKQAEVLNQIAHINYQMRQNYKLFAWRYRVLGTLGNQNHPLFFSQAPGLKPDTNSMPDIAPVVCVAHSFWYEAKDIDPSGFSLCKENTTNIINVKPPNVSGGLVPGANELPAVFQFIQDEIAKGCRESSIFNWLFAGRILVHFRVDGAVRKNLIRKLAQNLSLPDPLDLRNESIREGARNTFRFNLTDSNANGIQQFEYFNSMSQGRCAEVDFWLPEIWINPVIHFGNHRVDTANEQSCLPTQGVPNRQGAGLPNINGMDNLPTAFQVNEFRPILNGNQVLADHWREEPDPSTGLNSSVGFEKNPWCMVYSGVKATTVVSKPFDPLGGVTLTARAFAKPFGGRIGPWYGKTWPSGTAHSQAADRSQMVDPLLPSRNIPSGGLGAFNPDEDVVNYSRFPGDQFGIGSLQALSAMSEQFRGIMNFISNTASPSPIAYGNYDHLGGLPNLQNSGDSLARTNSIRSRRNPPSENIEARHRQFEVASVSPDVFDILYYSIEPAYFNNYFLDQTTNGGAQFSDNEKIFDFGSSKDMGEFPNHLGIQEQVQQARKLYIPGYPHVIREWQKVLTSWHQNEAVEYSLDPNRFGQCQKPVTKESLPTTGNCIRGGRTGYSVKLISRDYLQSGDHAIGGGSAGAGGSGPILNPPTF